MARLDHRAAQLLAAVLALVALIGFTQGLAQALRAPRPEQVEAGVDPSRDPVPAKALSAPALDEARVREIAREEAASALGAARKKAAAVAKPEESTDEPVARAPAAPEAAATVAAPAAAAPPATAPAPPG